MSDETIDKWGKLRLTEEEQHELQVDITEETKLVRRGQLCLIGLILSEKKINKEAFKTTMQNVWKTKGWIRFKGVGDNLFINEFQQDQISRK